MEKMKYRISSRATILLGRESVSKVDGAIIELVKNTYDADAVLCFICFDIAQDCIYILDNGIGMTKNTIENHWMLIGTDNKRENFRTDKRRIKSGEKGIGRFALDRLGSKCEMYTKNQLSDKVILWKTDWESFEQSGKCIDEVEAEYTYLDSEFKDVIPQEIYDSIADLNNTLSKKLRLNSGTLFKISKLRDKWNEASILNILDSMGNLIPTLEQSEYMIFFKKSLEDNYIIVENEITTEYDYKILASFDGEKFNIEVDRNEFDLNKMPSALFDLERFKKHPYRYEDFKSNKLIFKLSISELINSRDETEIQAVKDIGEFKFSYIFMKLALQEDSKEAFFYKEISKKRSLWLKNNAGIKIYRDNFLVRPYGDQDNGAFDWLGLDARVAKNPAAISHPSGNWHVRNTQGAGTVLISRITNSKILDKSNREGIIDNEYFKFLKEVLISIIALFEQDRAYIGYTMKQYSDIINKKAETKQSGKDIAETVLKKEKSEQTQNDKTETTSEQVETLAKTVQIFEEEREELITEIKLLNSLATNGLITTAIVHDLKGINACLVNRVEGLAYAIETNNTMLIQRNLSDLERTDSFLKSWITVITTQANRDKRTRLSKDLCQTIKDTINLLHPILEQKKIKINITDDNIQIIKRIFVSDFESIIYNLIINSIESFEKSRNDRIINIHMETKDNLWVLHYQDNGQGIDKLFKDHYDIFNYGTTSKKDGTGLGMYIVASTAREYNAEFTITEYVSGFGLDIKIPI